MALPVANLGYMPNLGSPGRGPTTVVDDPWSQLAAQALGTLLTQGIVGGVSNAFEKDYTAQAQNEGLAVDPEAQAAKWYQKPFTGATTDKSQLKDLRGQKASMDQMREQEKSSGVRARQASIDENRRLIAQGKLNMENTEAQHQNRLTELQMAQHYDTLRSDANRTAQAAENEAQRTFALERLNSEISAQERMLGRKLTAEEAAVVQRAVLDNIGRMVQNPGTPTTTKSPDGVYITTPADPSAKIDRYREELKRLGYPVMPNP